MRKLGVFAALFIAGPALAFVILLVGCEGTALVFAGVCGHNFPLDFVMFTVAAWTVLAVLRAVVGWAIKNE